MQVGLRVQITDNRLPFWNRVVIPLRLVNCLKNIYICQVNLRYWQSHGVRFPNVVYFCIILRISTKHSSALQQFHTRWVSISTYIKAVKLIWLKLRETSIRTKLFLPKAKFSFVHEYRWRYIAYKLLRRLIYFKTRWVCLWPEWFVCVGYNSVLVWI